MEDNKAREGGGAIFFVSNDRSGTMTLSDSTLRHNPSLGFETYPGHLLPRGEGVVRRRDDGRLSGLD